MDNRQIAVVGTIVLIAVLIVLFLFQSNKAPNFEANSPIDLNTSGQQSQSSPQVTELSGQDLVVGTGSAQVAAGDTILVHYIGSFMDGKKFDSSYDRNQPLEVTVGAGRVIPGFDRGVVGMKVGGKRKLIIPSDLAYGAQGSGPIPPNSPIQFEIELLEIKPKVTPTPSGPEASPDPNLTPSVSPSPPAP